MDADEQVDAARYPNFAALARDSTWYRNATTVQWLTEQAVPAVLTGIQPPMKHNLLPIYADHPHNVFTLLGRSYRVRAIESITQLCPHSICKNDRGSKTAAVSDTAGSLASDAGIVYLHLLLPAPLLGPDPGDRRQLGRLRPARGAGEEPTPLRGGGVEAVRKEHLPLLVADHGRRASRRCTSCTRFCRTCRTSTCPPAGATASRRRRSTAYGTMSRRARGRRSRRTSASCSRSSTRTAPWVSSGSA